MEDKSLEELKIIAKNRGIKGCSKLSKALLMQRLHKSDPNDPKFKTKIELLALGNERRLAKL
jgi:hypothetical protein